MKGWEKHTMQIVTARGASCVLVPAAITKLPPTRWLITNGHLFLTVLEPGKSQITMLEDLVSGEGLLPGPQECSSYNLTGQNGQGSAFQSVIRALTPITWAPPS